jgi:hypothetical protein
MMTKHRKQRGGSAGLHKDAQPAPSFSEGLAWQNPYQQPPPERAESRTHHGKLSRRTG